MIQPEVATVRPRVVGHDGEVRPLDDVLEIVLSRGQTRVLHLRGLRGSGKSTALRHIAAILASRPHLLDQCRFVDTEEYVLIDDRSVDSTTRLTIIAGDHDSVPVASRFRLAPWSLDDVIEYLLAQHPAACSSVMARIHDVAMCDGLPLLWTIALDALAMNQNLPNIQSALATFVKDLKLTSNCENALRRLAWMAVSGQKDPDQIMTALLKKFALSSMERFFIAEPIQCLMASQYYIEQVRSPRGQAILHHRVPDDLLPFVAEGLRHEVGTIEQLQNILTRRVDRALHAASMTLLIAINPTWRPRVIVREANLKQATLNHVCWPGIDLSFADLESASLMGADLSEAKLAGVSMRSANLGRTDLRRANLIGADLSFADLSGVQFQNADLTSVKFEGAESDGVNFDGAVMTQTLLNDGKWSRSSFRAADLSCASFIGSKLTDCDFTGAKLKSAAFDRIDLTTCCFDGACLDGAFLIDTFMEDVNWRGVSMRHANLGSVSLSGSQLQAADLRWANLSGARLGDIDWENADLRSVNLSGATFHMGSSRGGLVFSPYACEGSKTGFYTDEFDEQHFKAPEEIRKANLRGADLRGAILTGVDFYLVDLRDAKLDPDQLKYVKSCGAILTNRIVD